MKTTPAKYKEGDRVHTCDGLYFKSFEGTIIKVVNIKRPKYKLNQFEYVWRYGILPDWAEDEKHYYWFDEHEINIPKERKMNLYQAVRMAESMLNQLRLIYDEKDDLNSAILTPDRWEEFKISGELAINTLTEHLIKEKRND